MDTNTLKKAYQDAHDNHIMIYRKGKYTQKRAHEVGIEAVQTTVLDHLIAEAKALPQDAIDSSGNPFTYDGSYGGPQYLNDEVAGWLAQFKGENP